jgi:hypothetical protein
LAAWTKEGQRNVKYVNAKIPQPSEVGDVVRDGYLGSSSAYVIKGGKIATVIGNAPFTTTVYKLGGKYYGARSNEFGYANYEIIPAPSQLGTQVEYELR